MYKIFLSYNNNNEVLELPILPEKLKYQPLWTKRWNKCIKYRRSNPTKAAESFYNKH